MSKMKRLTREYLILERQLKGPGRRKKITRAVNEAHSRQLEILKTIQSIHPNQNPLAVIRGLN